jgi:hypothetical protein
MSISSIFAMGGDCDYGHYHHGKGHYHGGYGKYRYGYSSYNYHGYYRNYYYHRGGLLGLGIL